MFAGDDDQASGSKSVGRWRSEAEMVYVEMRVTIARSWLTHLRRRPIAEIRLDQHFLRQIPLSAVLVSSDPDQTQRATVAHRRAVCRYHYHLICFLICFCSVHGRTVVLKTNIRSLGRGGTNRSQSHYLPPTSPQALPRTILSRKCKT